MKIHCPICSKCKIISQNVKYVVRKSFYFKCCNYILQYNENMQSKNFFLIEKYSIKDFFIHHLQSSSEDTLHLRKKNDANFFINLDPNLFSYFCNKSNFENYLLLL